MPKQRRPHLSAALALSLVAASVFAAGTNHPPVSDWAKLWQPSDLPMPSAVTVRVAAGELGGLGKDLEDRDWQMVPTAHHHLHFQSSADRAKVAELHRLLDGVHLFLKGRSPAAAPTPIRVFLVPNERGHSRCSPTANALRTGEKGELPFLLTSVLHEETHLFNFAFPRLKTQNWWAGEFSCIYFEERAQLEADHRDVKQEFGRRLPKGPVAPLGELDRQGKDAFDSATAAMFFLEETCGRARFNEFRHQCLISAKDGNGANIPASIFREVFGKDPATLDKEWCAFFGWTEPRAKRGNTDSPPPGR